MFKWWKKGIDSTPPAPRIGRIELPDVETPVILDYRKAQSSNGWSSDSESSNSPSTPSTPWLKQPMPGTEHTKWGSRSSSPQSAQGRPSTPKLEVLKPKPRRSSIPNPELLKAAHRRCSVPHSESSVGTPKSEVQSTKPLKGILKPPRPSPPPHITLHWQLLPYHPQISKRRVYFDIRQRGVYFLQDHLGYSPVALKKSDLEKAASDQQIQPFTKMTICCAYLPDIKVHVSNRAGHGIQCADVFDSIYKEFNHALTSEERERYFSNSKGRLARCEAAFKKRCEDETTVVAAAELAKGMRRVDLLEGRTIFMGLRRPHDSDDKPNTYWVLELGYPPCDDKARR